MTLLSRPLRAATLALGAVLLVTACTAVPEAPAEPPDNAAAPEDPTEQTAQTGSNHLRRGPTVRLDETVAAENSVLELLDRRTAELQKSEARAEQLTKDLTELQMALKRHESDMAEEKAELQRAKALLREALTTQARLTDELLAVKIQKLRLEQDNVRLRMGALPLDGK